MIKEISRLLVRHYCRCWLTREQVSNMLCLSRFSPNAIETKMADADVEQELLDYEEQEEQEDVAADAAGDAPVKKDVKGTYVSIHSSGFRDFLLKPELLRSIVDCGFEHPSEGE